MMQVTLEEILIGQKRKIFSQWEQSAIEILFSGWILQHQRILAFDWTGEYIILAFAK